MSVRGVNQPDDLRLACQGVSKGDGWPSLSGQWGTAVQGEAEGSLDSNHLSFINVASSLS